MTAEERTEQAKLAAEKRWGSQELPRAEREGWLNLADRTIACAGLNDGRRVLTQETFLHAIGRARKAKAGTGSKPGIDGLDQVDRLPPFLVAANLKPFIDDKLRESTTPIVYRALRGGRGYGFEARLLPRVCKVYLRARDEGKLNKTQEHIAVACDLLFSGLAEVGIIALVDEATGHQYERARAALQEILDQFIKDELGKWAKRFPNEFYRQLFRLKGVI